MAMKIHIEHLSKTYPGGIRALRDVNLDIETGMFGLLGRNGAGKTTLLRIIATLLKPTSGCARVDGFDTSDPRQKWAVKQVLGYLPQEMGYYPSLTVTEFVDYIATLKNLHNPQVRAQAVTEVIALAGLRGMAHQRINTLSGGMKRRVGIAQALLGDPRLLIVDEPTAGLDPEERVRFRNLLAGLATERVVILSTHIVEDVAATCQKLAVLHQGQVCFSGSPAALAQDCANRVWEVLLPADWRENNTWHITSSVQQADGQWRLRLVGERPKVETAQAVIPTLEEAYLALMEKITQD